MGVLLRGTGKGEVERGQVLSAPGSIKPHKKFKAEVYVLKKEERGKAHAVFPWVSAAVLFKDNGCNGISDIAGRGGDGNAGGQRKHGGGVNSAGGDGGAASFCDKRGWKNRRSGCGNRNH